MKPTTVARIMVDRLFRRSVRESYWAARKTIGRLAQLLAPPNRVMALHVAKELTAYLLNSVQPIHEQTRERARAAVDWILRAHEATGDGGVSLGYFPCDEVNGWRASYPETTGYIISSLLEFSRRVGDDRVHEAALRMAHWEAEIQMPSGAVQGGHVCSPDKQTPCAFNTGMVLDGWSSAYRTTGEAAFFHAARRAADWLMSDLTQEGYFRTNGQFITPGKIKTYNCLCAWAMYRFGMDAGDDRYQRAALQAVEAALRQQQPNGWFANNCLARSEAPLLHTIGYTLQGIFEVGMLAKREDFVEAVQRTAEPLLSRVSQKGFMHGCYYPDWEPATFSSCLTGSAQLAVLWYRLYEHTRSQRYLTVADRIVNYLKALQLLDSPNPCLNGALAGSFPLFGDYMTAGYPNWATKYFLDSLMLQDRFQRA